MSKTKQLLQHVFSTSPFIKSLDMIYVDSGVGWCEASLVVKGEHLQHTGVVHAGVITTLADQCAGAAAQTLCQGNDYVLTVEFKMNLLRPGKGKQLKCRAQVLKPGRAFHVVEAEVFACNEADEQTLVAKLNGTLAVISNS